MGRCAEAFQDRYPSSKEVFNLPDNKESHLRWLLKAFPRIWLLNFHSNELSLFPCVRLPNASFYSLGLSILIKKMERTKAQLSEALQQMVEVTDFPGFQCRLRGVSGLCSVKLGS